LIGCGPGEVDTHDLHVQRTRGRAGPKHLGWRTWATRSGSQRGWSVQRDRRRGGSPGCRR